MELLSKRLRTPDLDINLNRFIREQVTRSWWLTVWLIILAGITLLYTSRRLSAAPITTIVVLLIWAVSIGLVVFNEVRHRHTKYTLWLKDNLYNSVTNALISLLLTLLLIAAFFSLFDYMVVNASWSAVPPTQLRAELAAVEGGDYCFTMGGIIPDESRTAIAVEREQRCFPQTRFSEAPAEGVVIGESAADFCFDTMPGDAANGEFCFESTAENPTFFEVQRQFSGANWGAVRANFTTLMIFRFERDEVWRLWTTIGILVALAVPSLFIYREKYKRTTIRQVLTILWVTTPLLFYILLRGVPDDIEFEPFGLIYVLLAVGAYLANRYAGPWLAQRQRQITLQQGTSPVGLLSDLLITLLRFGLAAGVFIFGLLGVFTLFNGLYAALGGITVGGEKWLSFLDPDRNWGGLLLTLIIAVFAIIVSFPIGLVLALGRRSKIGGIPAWLTYTFAIAVAIWGLFNSTPGNLEAARSTFEQVLAYWPLAVPVVAYLFQRTWNGNVLAAFTTLYIEFIRGIPLIAVLFISITLFPLILPAGVEILSVWRVMWGFTLFAAAYLAENVRGGLQSIPNGQYEAADALGLNTVQKYRLIILPQALRVVIPAIVGQFIGLFKDTTLVAFLGLLDFLGIANSLSANPAWLNIRREVYLFLAIVYFIGSALMAGYSRRLERRLGLGTR